jgi:capsid protein
LNLPAAKHDKFSAIEWKPRRWRWVDPLKDTQANVIAVANQLAESKGVELDADQAAISLNQSVDGF